LNPAIKNLVQLALFKMEIGFHLASSLENSTSATALAAPRTLAIATAATLGYHFLLHHVDDLVRDAQVLDCAASNVAFRHPPELVTILLRFI